MVYVNWFGFGISVLSVFFLSVFLVLYSALLTYFLWLLCWSIYSTIRIVHVTDYYDYNMTFFHFSHFGLDVLTQLNYYYSYKHCPWPTFNV